MDKAAIQAAIRSIEASVEMLKAACGHGESDDDYDEDAEEGNDTMPPAPPKMRGRRKTFFKDVKETE